ncbi:hypothetical protein [Paenibacillus mendelii]|uniref:Uncharacterized protein n=1 Tax=Paenibacillus mendelii TaxID=206163 RepID=A0ABV6J3P4_9BACL|nr:hypothetical protein [Paenibacillus mendelii]MCQ6563279.1 hypothetical protein [Paenibacillus mendelii]
MRIETGHAYSPIARRASTQLSQDLFEAALQQIEKEKEKQKEDKGKLVTAREGAYVRQYMVRPDGSKILISETKQTGEDSTTTDHDLQPASHRANGNNSGMSHNTAEALHLVSLQVGAAVPLVKR